MCYLVSHLFYAHLDVAPCLFVRVSVSKETPFDDFMGPHSGMQFPMWPTRRASTSSIVSLSHGQEQYYNEPLAGQSPHATQQGFSFSSVPSERDISFDVMPRHYLTHTGLSSSFAQEPHQAQRRGTFPRYSSGGPASLSAPGATLMRPNQGYQMDFADPSWMDPMQPQLQQRELPRRSMLMQASMQSMHSMPANSFSDSSGWFGEDEVYPPSSFNEMNRLDPIVPAKLPVMLALPDDRLKLSAHQVFLRYQIEAFKANEEDVTTHTRGRNKRIQLGQVGIRCRHCAHVPVAMRQKGSVYYPSTLLGLYQAAQNISATHLQCGLCVQTPEVIKRQFVALLSTRAFSSGAGRPYWAQSAKKLGLIDTPEGIRFAGDVAPEASEEGATSSITTDEGTNVAIP